MRKKYFTIHCMITCLFNR